MLGFIKREIARFRRHRRDRKDAQEMYRVYPNQYQWRLYLLDQRERDAREHSQYAIGGWKE